MGEARTRGICSALGPGTPWSPKQQTPSPYSLKARSLEPSTRQPEARKKTKTLEPQSTESARQLSKVGQEKSDLRGFEASER